MNRCKRVILTPILWLRRETLNIACKLADKIVVVTPHLASYLETKNVPREKVHIVPNGVNPVLFSPIDQTRARNLLGLKTKKKLIGYVGSLTAWQGLEFLILAASRLPEKFKDTWLVIIVGDGELRHSLQRLTESNGLEKSVEFIGFQPYWTIPIWISACDFMAAPKIPLLSGYSTLKVFEYMACSKPVIAAEVSGLEMISLNNAGVLFTPGDVDDLCVKLMGLMELPGEELKSLGENARRWVIGHATWSKSAQLIYEFANE